MAYVTPQSQNLKVAFSNKYSLPHYQREYKWESRHFEELVNDIQSAFLESFDPTHGRTQVADYAPYFLGSVITSTEIGGKKPLIDGQQRLTSAFILLAHLDRYQRANGVTTATNLKNYLGSFSFGTLDYAIEFSSNRKNVFNLYLDTANSVTHALDTAEQATGVDHGDLRIIAALRSMDGLLNAEVLNNIAYFIDYVIERVFLIDISVNTEAEAHRVFVTMNDRGLRLGPIDLLKGEILSHIPQATDVDAAHSKWVSTMNALKTIDPEEDSLFFKSFFRSKWADTIRGKSKGDAPGDYDVIGDAYHRWFADNVGKIGLNNNDHYLEFAKLTIPKFAEIYIFIRKAESKIITGLEHIYYNAARRYSFHAMVLLAAIDNADNVATWKAKLSITARLIDLILTSRAIEGKENNYDNLRDISFALTKDVRGKDLPSLEAYVRSQWIAYSAAIEALPDMNYHKSDKSNILYILARVGCHLEDAFGLTNKVGFETYWRRDKGGKTFDIEHLLKSAFDLSALPASHGFADQREYSDLRNRIGGLALLPRSRNRSLQDAAYRDKLGAYATESVITQTLDPALYTSNPNVSRFVAANSAVGLVAFSDFGKNEIAARSETYRELAKAVWAVP